jgi:ElaB/YqjD/DUF883 family membrane-anchored ribosome-binding protein
MTTSYSGSGMASSQSAPGAPEHILADIEQTRADLGDTVTALTGKVDPRTRMRGAVSDLRARTIAGVSRVRVQAPQRARQAQQAVRNRPVPAAVGVLTVAGAVTAVLLGRRAAKARSARNRWLPGFLHR